MSEEEDGEAVKGELREPLELYIYGRAIALAAEDAVRRAGFKPETENVHVTVLYLGEASYGDDLEPIRNDVHEALDGLWCFYKNEQGACTSS